MRFPKPFAVFEQLRKPDITNGQITSPGGFRPAITTERSLACSLRIIDVKFGLMGARFSRSFSEFCGSRSSIFGLAMLLVVVCESWIGVVLHRKPSRIMEIM